MPSGSASRPGTHAGLALVEVAARFERRAFTCALGLLVLACGASAALVPLRGAGVPAGGCAGVAAIASVVMFRARRMTFAVLTEGWAARLLLAFVAAGLVSLVPPLQSELWLISCTLLVTLAVVAGLRFALVACTVTLLANLAAHLVAGDLDSTPAVAVVGLWVGLPFWTATVGVLCELASRHVLLAHVGERALPQRSSFVPPPAAAAPAPPESVSDPAPPLGDAGLTAHQLRILALLCDGLNQRQVAACLGITAGAVAKRLAAARERTGMVTTNELVAWAWREGLVPSPHSEPIEIPLDE